MQTVVWPRDDQPGQCTASNNRMHHYGIRLHPGRTMGAAPLTIHEPGEPSHVVLPSEVASCSMPSSYSRSASSRVLRPITRSPDRAG